MRVRLLGNVGDYRLEEELGRGAFGAVYRATHATTQREVALKLFARFDAPPNAIERFRREPDALARAGRHPNLAAVEGWGEHNGLPWFAMELVRGPTLARVIEERAPITWREAAAIVRGLARALDHLHACGLVHRDVKPGNVILDPAGEPRLVDFGLALDTQRTRVTRQGQLLGTPLYMAVEQLRARFDDVGPNTDVHGLGVIFYELLTGSPPFVAPSLPELIELVEAASPRPPHEVREVPVTVSRLCLSMMAPQPSLRPAAREVADALEPALATEPQPPPIPSTSKLPDRVGAYTVISELGRGGAGIVVKARTPEGRDVAIKLLRRAGTTASEARFERESRLQGELGLAEGFVPLLARGETGGRTFLVMPYLSRGTLADRLRTGALPLEEAVAIGRAIAQAMGRAHARGIVHRDLKPANVLFSDEGAPLVADLGLAKHWRRDLPGASGSVSLSRTGYLRGTVGYMAPEQSRDSKSAGPAADVFSIGAILYELVTGRLAFEGETIGEVLEKLEKGPDPLRTVKPDVPPELSRVIERALALDPAERFQDAGELARALETGSLAPARSDTPSLVIFVVSVLLVAGVAAAAVLGRGRRAPDGPSLPETGTVLPPSPPGPERPVPRLCSSFLRTSRTRLLSVFGDYGWEHTNSVISVAVAARAPRVVSGGRDGVVKVWSPDSREELCVLAGHEKEVSSVAVSADGKVAASGALDRTIRIWDVERRTLSRAIEVPFEVHAVALSPDGRTLVAGGRTKNVLVYDLSQPGATPRELTGHGGDVKTLALSADGQRLLSSGKDRIVKLRDLETGREIQNLEGHGALVLSVALSPDGEHAVSSDQTGTIKLWDLVSGGFVGNFTRSGDEGPRDRRVPAVAISPDGRRVVAGAWDGRLHVFDLATRSELKRIEAHDGGIMGLAFTHDGRALTASWDRTIGRWHLETGKDTEGSTGHAGSVYAITPLPDGRVLSAGQDRKIRFWDVATATTLGRPLEGHQLRIHSLVLSPDRTRLLSASWDGTLKEWDLGRGREIQTLDAAANLVSWAAHVSGNRAVSVGHDGAVRVWDLTTGRLGSTLATSKSEVLSAATSPDRTSLVTGQADGAVRLFDLSGEPREVAVLGHHAGDARVIDVDGTGKRALSGGDDGVVLWDLVTRAQLRVIEEDDHVVALAFSPDGRLALVSGQGGMVRLWDLERGELKDAIDLHSSSDLARAITWIAGGREVLIGTARGVILRFAVDTTSVR